VTNLHTFLPGGTDGLCSENFGGVTRCALPKDSEWHARLEAAVLPPLPQYGGDSPEGVRTVGSVSEVVRKIKEDTRAALSAGSGDYAWFNPEESVVESVETEVDRAVRWLESPEVELGYGPWPVRKFILPDAAAEPNYRMRACIEALERLEKDYCLTVARPDGAGWRVALLTWDWAYGLSLETVCDELVVRYEPSSEGAGAG
jgi:hypothetical protein